MKVISKEVISDKSKKAVVAKHLKVFLFAQTKSKNINPANPQFLTASTTHLRLDSHLPTTPL